MSTESNDTSSAVNSKSRACVVRVENFSFAEDVCVGEVGSGTFKNAKITHKVDNGAILLSLHGGGTINKEFGVEESVSFGGFNVSITLSERDHAALSKVHSDMVKAVLVRREQFFPGSTKSEDFLAESANKTVHAPKAKKDSPGTWPASMTIKVDKVTDLIPDSRGVRHCKVKSTNGEYLEDIYSLKGANWVKAVIELKGIYSQSGKLSFGVSKRLRILTVSPSTADLEIPSESEEDEDEDEDEDTKSKRQRTA
jgi:hypothetical protein